MTCRRRDESSSLLLQVNESFYDSPQMYRTSQSSFKELIWARHYSSAQWARIRKQAQFFYFKFDPGAVSQMPMDQFEPRKNPQVHIIIFGRSLVKWRLPGKKGHFLAKKFFCCLVHSSKQGPPNFYILDSYESFDIYLGGKIKKNWLLMMYGVLIRQISPEIHRKFGRF